MGIRPFRPADTAAVDALLDSDADALRRHQLRALHGPNRDDPRWRRTVVAERDGAVVGAGTVLASRLRTVGTGDLYGKPVAWINVAAEGRGGGALANLAEVLRYVGASIVEPACVRLPVPRGAVGPDGTLRDADLRAGIAAALESLAAAVDAAPVSD